MIDVLWIVQILIALPFLLAGGMKLVLPLEAPVGAVALPGFFVRFVGVVEVPARSASSSKGFCASGRV